MVVGLDARLAGGHHHLRPAHDGGEARRRRQRDFGHRSPGDSRRLQVSVDDRLERLGHAATQRMGDHHVAAPHVRQDRAHRDELRSDDHVDRAVRHQLDVGRPVDQRDGPARAQATRHQRRHDVVLVVVGQRAEHVDLLDVLVGQERLVGRVAVEHHRVVEGLGQVLGPRPVVLDHLDRRRAFERLRQPHADMPAPGDQDAAAGQRQLAELRGEAADLIRDGHEEHIVVRFDDRRPVDGDRCLPPVHGDHPERHARQAVGEAADRSTDRRASGGRADLHQNRPPAGELADLDRRRVLDQQPDVAGDELFRADHHVDRYPALLEQRRIGEVIGRPDARDQRRHPEQRVGDLAGEHVGLVAVGRREQQVGVAGAGFLQHPRARRRTDHRPDIELLLERLKRPGFDVDDGDVVLLVGEAVRDGAPDLARAEDDDVHRRRRLQ